MRVGKKRRKNGREWDRRRELLETRTGFKLRKEEGTKKTLGKRKKSVYVDDQYLYPT